MAISGLSTSTSTKNTIEITRGVTVTASNKNANNPQGLTIAVQATNAKEITRGNAALLSNQN